MRRRDGTEKPLSSRRDFLKTSSAAALGGAMAASGLGRIPGAYAAGSDEIRIGLIGCGERGTGAAENALSSAPGVKLVAMADVFKDHLDTSLDVLKKSEVADKVAVAEDHRFVGFDAYQKLLALDEVNYVILATPPGFRPPFVKAAIEAGKNTFAEKPVGVDGPGVRTALEAYELANQKRLAVGVGTQRRHQTGYLETMKRIH
ncbi:MAG TPA: Gfo/Idh/MocA family oxidoreductase, partial [Terriglobia bacterium]|nr:Gfo/Idh/MocA family oxidoreductase [Terriglobia bacterium]